MFRCSLVVLGLLVSGWQSAATAQWQLPPGVKTFQVNGYPMAFLERGTGEPVVLVHGVLNDYRSWSRQTASPPAGFRLIAVSLRHSYPERWDGKGDKNSERQHAEDLAAFIEALGIGPVHLVGHSMGGIAGFRMAQARPDLIKSLVLMEAPIYSLLPPASDSGEGQNEIATVLKAVKARFEQGDIEGGLQLWVDRDTPGTWQRRSDATRQRPRDNAWTLIQSGDGSNPITCSDFKVLTMPVLLMQGEKTPRRLANIVDATHKCLPSSEHMVIPDAGHAMHVMNPAAFEKALVQFLSK
jgi:esterase